MFVKVMAALLLTLPLGAYIAGTLVSARVDMPDQRAPVVLETSPSPVGDVGGVPPAEGEAGPRVGPTDRPRGPGGATGRPDDGRTEPGDDPSDDPGGDERDDDVEVVRPSPREVEDLREERAEAREDRRDDLADAREDRRDDLADARRDDRDDDGGGPDDEGDDD